MGCELLRGHGFPRDMRVSGTERNIVIPPVADSWLHQFKFNSLVVQYDDSCIHDIISTQTQTLTLTLTLTLFNLIKSQFQLFAPD